LRARRPGVRRHPRRRLQHRHRHPGPKLPAAADQQLLPGRRHRHQHRSDVQHRINLRPVHGYGARDGPRSGLLPASVSTAVMWPTYTRVMSLQADDIAGIRNIYSNNNPRSYDFYNGANNSFVTAADVTGLTDPLTQTVLVTGLDNTWTSQQEYYTVVAPPLTLGTMTVQVQSVGLSLLSPFMTVYDACFRALGSDGSDGRTATTLSVTVDNVVAGQRYYVRVKGADSTSFSTGAYAMTFQFSIFAPPPVPTPDTTTANGSPISGGGGVPLSGRETHEEMAVFAVNKLLHGGGCACAVCRAALARLRESDAVSAVSEKPAGQPGTSEASTLQSPRLPAIADDRVWAEYAETAPV